ncbi:MAG: tagaturonate epimerase family protein [Opitutaceae bacterium]
MSAINRFLLENNLRIRTNPCVSPDFCLDWPGLSRRVRAGGNDDVTFYRKSHFTTAQGQWLLFEDGTGDCGWQLDAAGTAKSCDVLAEGVPWGTSRAIFPATFANLLRLKNLVQEHHPDSTIFPTAGPPLGRSTLGIGARFTTLHWPAVEWAMATLGIGLTANQNSVPRELVYDVEAMLAGRLDPVPFPFIGASVPEGHQGQSIEGMSHGCVLSKLKTGFHRRGIAWSFNADHQPIGGKFDSREDRLVAGCVLASYITFDLLPELAQTPMPADPVSWVNTHLEASLVAKVKNRVTSLGLVLNEYELAARLAQVWPGVWKMKLRDDQYRAARERLFSTAVGRAYLRELSIDELPGLTAPETTATMLALCEALEIKIHFIAPAFDFQKNMPYADDDELRRLIEKQVAIGREFDTGIGFHSGSGKSAGNYQVIGAATAGRFEVKTSGRFTYEMGRALHASTDEGDQRLWRDWYRFTVELALASCFSPDATEQKMARRFVTDALAKAGRPADVFATPAGCRTAVEALPPSPEHMFWFEYNFLFVLAAGGRADKSALGDHTGAGYAQRARFYSISDQGRLNYAKNVVLYIVFLAEHTGLARPAACASARALLSSYTALDQMLADIAPI